MNVYFQLLSYFLLISIALSLSFYFLLSFPLPLSHIRYTQEQLDDSIAEASSRVERIYTALERERRNSEQQLRVRTFTIIHYPLLLFFY